jgi:hypothetical protein
MVDMEDMVEIVEMVHLVEMVEMVDGLYYILAFYLLNYLFYPL